MTSQVFTDEIRAAWTGAGLDTGALKQLRSRALDAFEASGFPTPRIESWKYTNTQAIAEAFPKWLATAPGSAFANTAPTLAIEDAILITFVDGVYCADLSKVADIPPGVVLGSMTELQDSQPAALESLGTLSSPADSGFVALNTAFAGNGTVLRVPAGQQLQQPVYIRYLSAHPEVNAQPRLLVHLAEGASATVVEHYCSTSPALVNPVAELICGDASSLKYYKLQSEHPDAWHTAVQYAALGSDATLNTTHVDIGGNIARNELKVFLNGQGAHAECSGLFMADGARHVESRIDVNHIAPNTTSRERFRGILGGKARGVFNGRIYVHQDGQKTSAELTNRNLLLNAGAEINTKPELEIYADDVKCAHGSTTGQLDETSFFYLLTRGVAPAVARKMLITAFAAELLTNIAVPAIADYAQQALEQLQSTEDEAET